MRKLIILATLLASTSAHAYCTVEVGKIFCAEGLAPIMRATNQPQGGGSFMVASAPEVKAGCSVDMGGGTNCNHGDGYTTREFRDAYGNDVTVNRFQHRDGSVNTITQTCGTDYNSGYGGYKCTSR